MAIFQSDIDNYGEDLVSLVQRGAAQVSQQVLGPAIQNLEQQNANLQQALAIEARRNLDRRVADLVPDFATLDRDPRWLQWLRQTDPLSGRSRQELLNDAADRLDANRIAFFFKSWQREETAAGQSPGRPSPHRAATRDAASAPSGRLYTRAEIGQLYEKHRRGVLTGDAWARQEADIFAAQREGRLQMTPYLTK